MVKYNLCDSCRQSTELPSAPLLDGRALEQGCYCALCGKKAEDLKKKKAPHPKEVHVMDIPWDGALYLSMYKIAAFTLAVFSVAWGDNLMRPMGLVVLAGMLLGTAVNAIRES